MSDQPDEPWPVEIRIPLGTNEAIRITWLVTDGQTVRPGEPLMHLEVENAYLDLESRDAGVVEHAVASGADVMAGQLVGRIRRARSEL